jgi:hypothetical protein
MSIKHISKTDAHIDTQIVNCDRKEKRKKACNILEVSTLMMLSAGLSCRLSVCKILTVLFDNWMQCDAADRQLGNP